MTVTNLRFFFFVISIFKISSLQSQDIDKANKHYQVGAYSKAIPIYEAALAQKPNLNAVKSKLANAYRILNQPQKAIPLYAQIVDNESVISKDLLNYGETLMSIGNYEWAKKYFNLYQQRNPEDASVILLLAACDKVNSIPAYFKNVEILDFQQNTNADENAPFFYKEWLIYASDRDRGFELLKVPNGTTGRDYLHIYYAEQWDESTFGSVELFPKVNELNKNTGNLTFTKTGSEIFFCRNSVIPSKTGAYNMQLYTAAAKDGMNWQHIQILPFCTPDNNYLYPSISPDGKMLFFIADKAQGLGGMDIYVSRKNKKGWSRPENLGDNINTAGHEAFPFYDGNGHLYFASKGHPGFGGFDMFVSHYDSTLNKWGKAINLGLPLNSSYDDHNFCLDSTGTAGAFTSSRSGRGDDIFLFKIKQHATHPRQKDTLSYTISRLDASPKTKVLKTQRNYLQEITDLADSHLLKINQRFVIESNIYDSLTQTAISERVKSILMPLVSFLKKNPRFLVEIGSHLAEKAGDKDLYKKITTQRAEKIIAFLQAEGVSAHQLKAKGYGNLQPLKDCVENDCSPTEAAANERIELKIKRF
ncbi:MAG: OmpA/MotB protein [Bacteroidota bacterium]|jgi:outer membrane protein OmpA-like peptidoglycan-associated protein/tetratricopeptide (TPR) repeat protein